MMSTVGRWVFTELGLKHECLTGSTWWVNNKEALKQALASGSCGICETAMPRKFVLKLKDRARIEAEHRSGDLPPSCGPK
jgi:hypothetical protein